MNATNATIDTLNATMGAKNTADNALIYITNKQTQRRKKRNKGKNKTNRKRKKTNRTNTTNTTNETKNERNKRNDKPRCAMLKVMA